MAFCPNCGNHVPDHANFCLGCGKPMTQQMMPIHMKHQSSSLKAAGVLAIVGAVFCLLAGIFAIFDREFIILVSLIFNPLCFAFGLTGGILVLKRRPYTMAIIGISFIIAGGGLALLGRVIAIFGMIALLMGILALVFTLIGKRELLFQMNQQIPQPQPINPTEQQQEE